MVDAVLFSSDNQECGTPQEFFDMLDKEFCFTLDVCATSQNAKCEHFYDKDKDGLATPWHGTVWVNPPYGKEIGAWVAKAYLSAQFDRTVVLLIPSRTDTAYWHDYVMKSSEIRFVRGRLKFDNGGEASAPFPSAIVVFRPKCQGPPAISSIGRFEGELDD